MDNNDYGKKLAEAALLVLQAAELVKPYNGYAGISLAYTASALITESKELENYLDESLKSMSVEVPEELKEEIDSIVQDIDNLI